MTIQPITRRQVLMRGGLAAVAVFGMRTWSEPAAADDAVPLSPGRAATYAALVVAVGSVPGNQVDADAADRAGATFAEWYAEGDDGTRAYMDAVLDAIAAAPPDGTAFADLDVDQRVGVLRSLSRSADRDDAGVAAGANALAAWPFYPNGLDDHPPEVTL